MAKLDNPKLRLRFLEAVRTTGMISDGIWATGMTSSALARFRNTHPEFDQAILDAVQYYYVQQNLEYGQETRKEAAEYWAELISSKEIKQELLFKYLFERDNRTG
jgi:hypothetical protein